MRNGDRKYHLRSSFPKTPIYKRKEHKKLGITFRSVVWEILVEANCN